MSKKYHIVVGQTSHGTWVMHFGDYDKEVATQEMYDERDAQKSQPKEHRLSKMRVITLNSDTQQAINAKMHELNA